jgi:hypothetical protein
MFAYLNKMYRYNMINLFIDNYNYDDYLFDTETIGDWANEYNIKVLPQYEDIPLQFNCN